MTPAVFLDRDGTLIDDVGYLDRLDQVAIYPWTADALRLLRRGRLRPRRDHQPVRRARAACISEAFVGDVHAHLAAELARGGASIDAWFHCPHHDDADDPAYRLDCDCRKPKPGLVDARGGRARPRSGALGRRRRSLERHRRWPAPSAPPGILVETGAGAREALGPVDGLRADAVLPSLAEAASWILRERR